MASYRCKFSQGNQRYVQVNQWKGKLKVDFREWQDDVRPTKKGISLTLMRLKNLPDQLEFADRALENMQSYWNHMGGNVYICITDNSDIRRYWKPEQDKVPTGKGICLRPKEYSCLKELVPEIRWVLPELDTVVPCYRQSDHMNQLGALQCPVCNPNDCGNW